MSIKKPVNKIEKLINELCPDGVEFKVIGQIVQFAKGASIPRNRTSVDYEVPYLHYGDIYKLYNKEVDITAEFGSIIKVSVDERIRENQYLHTGDIVYNLTSETKKDLGKAVVIKNDEDCKFIAGTETTIMKIIQKNIINPCFLNYLIMTFSYLKEFRRHTTGTKVFRVHPKAISKIKIPIPPLTIQKEIVKILDNFTQLEAELEAELEARKKQYEHYREALLSFDNGVEFRELGEVADYSRTRVSATKLNDKNYVGVDNLLQNKQGKTISNCVPISGNLTRYENGDILIGNIRPYLKKIWLATNTGGTNGDVLVFQIKQNEKSDLGSRYLYHLLASDYFFSYNMQFAKGAKMPRGDKSAIMKFKIPIPPLPEQKRIVAILDKFDALVNDISVGLPAEISARKKQYEYYRNQLLTFTPSDSSGI